MYNKLTNKVDSYYTSPQTINALFHILSSHPEKQLRQLAAVEARKLVAKQWSKVQNKDELRKTLLEATFEEDDKLVRHSAARVITAVAKVDFGSEVKRLVLRFNNLEKL